MSLVNYDILECLASHWKLRDLIMIETAVQLSVKSIVGRLMLNAFLGEGFLIDMCLSHTSVVAMSD